MQSNNSLGKYDELSYLLPILEKLGDAPFAPSNYVKGVKTLGMAAVKSLKVITPNTSGVDNLQAGVDLRKLAAFAIEDAKGKREKERLKALTPYGDIQGNIGLTARSQMKPHYFQSTIKGLYALLSSRCVPGS